MKKTVEVVVFEDDSCEYSLPEKTDEFMKWWRDKIEEIPEEYRDTGLIRCFTSMCYDSTELQVKISYTRLETDAEEAARLKKEDAQRAFIENQELCQLEKLKAKYGI
jgi:hypothetical protein